MKHLTFWLALIASLAASVAAAWDEPARGTKTRGALMDAMRPHAAWVLGPGIEFVVYDLRRSGDLAFANVWPQRPGGAAIDLARTPAALRGELEIEMMDGVAMQALFQKSGDTWVAVHWAIGATDVWYAWPALCDIWRPVIPNACQGL